MRYIKTYEEREEDDFLFDEPVKSLEDLKIEKLLTSILADHNYAEVSNINNCEIKISNYNFNDKSYILNKKLFELLEKLNIKWSYLGRYAELYITLDKKDMEGFIEELEILNNAQKYNL